MTNLVTQEDLERVREALFEYVQEEGAKTKVNAYLAKHRRALLGSKLTATRLKEIVDGSGIIFEYDPHAGDEGDW